LDESACTFAEKYVSYKKAETPEVDRANVIRATFLALEPVCKREPEDADAVE
jgi:hypothetical protein